MVGLVSTLAAPVIAVLIVAGILFAGWIREGR